MRIDEPLDYCRVKKISDKGYGFLTSLHYDQNVFFHFNGIKDPNVKEKLEKMKRGDIHFYFTSYLMNGKRRLQKLWLDLSEVDRELIPDFAERITGEFISGETNPFETAYVIKQLRKYNFLNKKNFQNILTSEKMKRTPQLLKAMLLEELDEVEQIDNLIEKYESQKISKEEWTENILSLTAD